MFDQGRPLFLQIAESIEDSIVDGSLEEESKAPSTNELATFHRINPATAAKGVSELVDRGILYKKRGIGMFVATGSRTRLVDERTQGFAHAYISPLLAEARRLRLGPDDVIRLITEYGAVVEQTEQTDHADPADREDRAAREDRVAHRSPQEA